VESIKSIFSDRLDLPKNKKSLYCVRSPLLTVFSVDFFISYLDGSIR